MLIYVPFLIGKLRMILQMIHMMDILSSGVLAGLLTVLTFIVLLMQDLSLQCSPLPVIVEGCSILLSDKLSYLISSHMLFTHIPCHTSE